LRRGADVFTVQKLDCENVRLGNPKGNGRMDLEEQRLKHQIEASEMALKQKINLLKERIEHFKRMADVKSKVQQRPGLMFTGSILAGFLTKKLATGKKLHPAYTHRADSRDAQASATGGLWDPMNAIISTIATRAAVGIIGEIVGKLMPRRRERWQSGQNARHN
jgi:hypothetical protein